jgi:hypothetical protein
MSSDHFLKGFLLSGALNILAFAAALALGLRAKLSGRAELALATIMIWNFLVMCPVYALGFTGHLDARTLALVSAPWFVLVLAVARWRTPLSRFARDLLQTTVSLARLPLDACLVTLRARSFVAIGVLLTLSMVAWTFICAYLAPSWKQWDALWYHEPIVGFTIQNHGFAIVDLPLDVGGAQKINGYPRLCEMTQLWFVIFMDRRVIDMVGHVAAPAIALSVYVMARRYTRDVTLAIALGCAMVLMPACAKLLGSTYVDVHNAAFVLAGAHFATRPKFSVSHALIASICLTLAVGSKTMALVPVGILSLVAAGRLPFYERARPLASIATIAFGMVLIGGMMASVYYRNWVHFGNPFWPELRYDNDKWGIHWPGQGDVGFEGLKSATPASTLLELLYEVPGSLARPLDQLYEYGIAVPWVGIPVAVVGVGALLFALVRHALGLVVRRPSWRAAPETLNLVPLVVTLAASLKLSPALWGARYQIAAVGLLFVVVSWVAGRPGLDSFGKGVAGAVTALGIASFFWITPRTWLSWSEAVALAKIPFPLREFTPATEVSPTMPGFDGSPVTKVAGLAREKELAPGAVVAIPGNYGIYLALFWNNEFSNRVVYVPDAVDWVGQVMKTEAIWTYCPSGSALCSALHAPGSGWEAIGPLDVERHGTVFRRTRW